MKTILENFEETCNFNTTNNARDTYYEKESILVKLVGDYVKGHEVSSQTYGIGKITNYYGATLNTLIVVISFSGTVKQFSLEHLITVGKVTKFVEQTPELLAVWKIATDLHTKLTNSLKEIEQQEKIEALEAAKKAEAARKAEEKYEARKAKVLKEFTNLTQQDKTKYATGEFYYNLGWLANHVGSVSVALPDYLLNYFEKHFGAEANPTVIDSKKRTVNGHPMQYTFSMKASLPKKAIETIPGFLAQFLNSSQNALTNTSFIWELVDNYGFKFGKKQDIDHIKSCVPAEFLEVFTKGSAA